MVSHFIAPSMRQVEYPWGGLLAQAAEAKGAKLNATLGVFLDDDLRIGILPAVAQRVTFDRSQVTEYAPSHGVLKLRQLWRQRLADLGHVESNAADKVSNPIVTAGLTAGLSLAGQLFLEPRASELVVSDPCWPNYELMFQDIQHASIRPYPMFTDATPGEKPRLNLLALRTAIDASAKNVRSDLAICVLLNVPHNPTGYSYTKTEAHELVALFQSTLDEHPHRRFVVVIDDAYSGFVYDEAVRTTSVFRELSQLSNRLLAVHLSGVTKELYAWGLRVGFITFGAKGLSDADLKHLEDKAAAVVRGTLSNVSMLSQQLAIETLLDPQTHTTHLAYSKMMRSRYERCCAELERRDVQQHFVALPFNSGYFFALEIRNPNTDAEQLRKALLEKHSVGVVTIGPRLIRIAFSAVRADTIPSLFDALVDTAQELGAGS
jgi:aspartate/methionine/tyrosine aminotransferase